ncbi:hypothetical protein BH10ACT10_BH10ACT10_12240 [soil metagenome]
MTSTADTGSGPRDLPPDRVLSALTEARRTADREEARILALAVTWVDLHPVTRTTPAVTIRARHGVTGAVLSETLVEVPLAGAGTPGIADYAVETLAAALGLSYASGLRLVSEAVELSFRLPALWALVQDGRLQAWKARQVANATTELSCAAVAFVDRHVAVVAARNTTPTPGKLRELLHEAIHRCDPDQATGIEQAALDARGVWFDHRASTATTDVTARLDTLDALDLESSVAGLAGLLGRLGDDRGLDLRQATALGLLAHPQRALDLASTDPATLQAGQPAHPAVNGSTGTLFLHVGTDDLVDGSGGRVEKLGAATLHLLQDWIARVSSVTIRPVLDLGRTEAVDVHDPPDWMRETVILRDRHCVFPGCRIDARSCDLDHIEPYRPPEDGGPPDQTRTANLAALCRRHHRVKTFTPWTYRRLPDGDYQWTNPHGHTFLVTAGD